VGRITIGETGVDVRDAAGDHDRVLIGRNEAAHQRLDERINRIGAAELGIETARDLSGKLASPASVPLLASLGAAASFMRRSTPQRRHHPGIRGARPENA
jgi:hypothetical protein